MTPPTRSSRDSSEVEPIALDLARQTLHAGEHFARVLGMLHLHRRRIESAIDVHETIYEGLPRSSAVFLLASFQTSSLHLDECVRALNISSRSWHRIKANKKEQSKPLDVDQSSRLWSMAEILAAAEEVLGSREEAEEWLARPAIALNSRRPIDLMSTPQGAELVKTLLTQVAHGVYA